MSNLPKVHCGMKDQEAIEYCKSSRMYLKDDIVNLSTKCDVKDIDKKTRDQLCESISNVIISGDHLKLDCHDQGKRCQYGNKNEITMLAENCKVDPNGTNKEVCVRIANSIIYLPTHSNSNTPSASSSSGTPPIGTAPIGTPPIGTPPIGTPPIGTPPALKYILNHPPNPSIDTLKTYWSVLYEVIQKIKYQHS
jgi:hypothetical protein